MLTLISTPFQSFSLLPLATSQMSAIVDDASLPSNSESEEEELVEEKVEEITDLSSSDVITKYQTAAKIANLTLSGVIQMCVLGADITEICNFGEDVINAHTRQNTQSHTHTHTHTHTHIHACECTS